MREALELLDIDPYHNYTGYFGKKKIRCYFSLIPIRSITLSSTLLLTAKHLINLSILTILLYRINLKQVI